MKIDKNLVFIKDIKIYGEIIASWEVYLDGIKDVNYVIRDFVGIEHERYSHEIEFVDDIQKSIKKAKCNLPLEKLLELFTNIDKKYSLYIQICQKKEYCLSDVYVPYIFCFYGLKSENNENLPCFIQDGKLVIKTSDYIPSKDEYECCLYCYDTNYKDVLFQMYMNIYTKILKNSHL